MRIKLKNMSQKEFLDLTVERLSCGSLRGILQYGVEVSYSCLKNYYTERRLFSKAFFNNFFRLAKINMKKEEYFELDENWGRVKGGKKSKRIKGKA